MFWKERQSQQLNFEALVPTSCTVARFLSTGTCPEEWLCLDLYVFRDDNIAFYVGQSDCAFARVWTHLHGGFKGRSSVGKFVRVNWPRSMRFTIDLFYSGAPAFQSLHNDRTQIERTLIADLRPTFNRTHNVTPGPLPADYVPPTRAAKYPRNIGKMIREAERAVNQADNISIWGLLEEQSG